MSDTDDTTVRIALAELKAEALTQRARFDALPEIIRRVDADALLNGGTVDMDRVRAAVQQILADEPALHRGPASSGPELGQSWTPLPYLTQSEIAAMPPDELAERVDEINDALAGDRIIRDLPRYRSPSSGM